MRPPRSFLLNNWQPHPSRCSSQKLATSYHFSLNDKDNESANSASITFKNRHRFQPHPITVTTTTSLDQATSNFHLDYCNCLPTHLPGSALGSLASIPKMATKDINRINSLLCSKPSSGFLFLSKLDQNSF